MLYSPATARRSDAALRPILERIAQISRDRLQDQRRLEVPAPEVVLGSALQFLGNRSQDHGPPEPEGKVDRPDERSTPEICDRPGINSAVCCLSSGATIRCYPVLGAAMPASRVGLVLAGAAAVGSYV